MVKPPSKGKKICIKSSNTIWAISFLPIDVEATGLCWTFQNLDA